MRLLLLAPLLLTLAAIAQMPPPTAPSAGVVEAAAQAVEENYVFPDVGRQIAEKLRAKEKSGAYAGIADPEELAKVLTADIQSVNGDKHLRVRPAAATASFVRPTDGNNGVARAEILAGNVGYLDLRVFPPLFMARDVLGEAMRKIAGARALIIDLRRHRGGAPDTVAFASSFLFGDAPVHLNSIYRRIDDSTAAFHTDPSVPGPRFGPAKPVYVLTGARTFSAGEEFAYDLQTQKRATLIGETTGGGANPGAIHSLPQNLTVFVSNGRAINPITGTNWEGVGVKPEIPTSFEEAFPVAYRKALESVDLAQLPAAERAQVEELLKNPPVPQ